jgi:DUF971 family protein
MQNPATITSLDKNNEPYVFTLKFNEGQPVFLSSNKTSVGCPSLHLTVEEIQQRLINAGYSSEMIQELSGCLRGIVRHTIIKNLNQQLPYD